GTSAGQKYTIATTSVTRTGGPTINYVTLGNLVLRGGSGSNTVNVQSNPAGTAVAIQSGSGSNVINLGNPNNRLDDLLGALTLKGQGPTSVNINDQGSSTAHGYTLTASTLARDGIGLISFAGALGDIGVNAGNGDDVLTIMSEPAVFPVVFDGGSGTNTLLASNAANHWYIGAQGAGQVNTVFFQSVQDLSGGADTDTFTFLDGAGVSGSIDGGGGINTLDYSAYTSNVIVDLPLSSATGVG